MKLWQRIKNWFKSLINNNGASQQSTPAQVPSAPSSGSTSSSLYAPTVYREKVEAWWSALEVKTLGRQDESDIEWHLKKIANGKSRYLEAEKASGVPWQIIAVIHGLEASYDFNRQILNGQSYKVKTTIVPKGYGPFKSWLDAASKAFAIKKSPDVWDVANTLYFLERYNGMGYWNKGKPSPYLWAYSNAQVPGKYIKDHVYDSNFISLQVGAAILLKRLGWN